MTKKFSRRTVLGVAASTLASPALSLTPGYIEGRGDLRIGLLADYPPYVFLRSERPHSGILPSIGSAMAQSLWLTPSFSVITPVQYLGAPINDIFAFYGGLDVLMHVPKDIAVKEGILHSSSYISDGLGFIGLPDVRTIGIYPSTFRGRKVLFFPDQMVQRELMSRQIPAHFVDVSYETSINDLSSRIPLEKLLNNEVNNFVASRRQLEWMNSGSVHQFQVNDLLIGGKSTQREFCVAVNPDSAWILEKIENHIAKMRSNYELQLLYNKYNLILVI